VAGRDSGATWGPTYRLGRSKPHLLYDLQNGLLDFQTWPPGLEHLIDWSDPYVREHFDVQASQLTKIVLGPRVPPILASRQQNVGIEVRVPSLPAPPADAPAASSSSVKWAQTTTRRLRDEGKLPEGMLQAELARLLETEAGKAVKTGQLRRALKASYLENQLAFWGIWPLGSLK
jgi:hypothetical protein